MRERKGSTFTAECHGAILREIHLGDPVQVSVCWSGRTRSGLHTFEEMRHAAEGWLSATSENMTIHIDMTARKTAPFHRIFAPASRHWRTLTNPSPRPEGIGRKVAMPSK